MCIYMYVCIYVYVCTICVYVHVCMYVLCMYVCMYVCVLDMQCPKFQSSLELIRCILFTAADRHSVFRWVSLLPYRCVPEAVWLSGPPCHRQIQRLLRHCCILCAKGTHYVRRVAILQSRIPGVCLLRKSWERYISLHPPPPSLPFPSSTLLGSLSLQALPLCIASIRNIHNQCPREVLSFLIDLFKFSDNQTNKVR